MTLWIRSIICRFLALQIFLLSWNAYTLAAEVRNVVVTNTRDDLLVYLNVDGAFRDKTIDAVLSGVPTSFSYIIALYRVRYFWIDKKIREIRVTHTIKFNPMKKEFVVDRSWEEQPVTSTSFVEAQQLMSAIDGLNLVGLDKLEKGRRYQIRAKAKLDKLTLPFYLHYILFFLSLWDFETDWYAIDFVFSP